MEQAKRTNFIERLTDDNIRNIFTKLNEDKFLLTPSISRDRITNKINIFANHYCDFTVSISLSEFDVQQSYKVFDKATYIKAMYEIFGEEYKNAYLQSVLKEHTKTFESTASKDKEADQTK